jgi:outer membrane receptor for ferrienterochelin and colicins
MTKTFSIILFCFLSFPLFAQKDSTGEIKLLNEIVVTSTRTENKLGNVAVPVSVINKKTINQSGSLRLKD